MIKSELIARIAEQNPHLYASEVEAIVGAILDRIASALAAGDRVELRDFGTFAVKELDARTGRNPRTGQSVAVAARRTVQFKPGKTMRARVNLKKADPEQDAERILRAF